MLKSGLIVGAISFVLGLIATIITPLCAPCVALIAGLAAGYLGGLFDKPGDQGSSAKLGASSGAIAAVGGLIGNMIAAVINTIIVGPEGAAAFSSQLGLPSGDASTFATSYYVSAIGLPCCIALFNVALMAGLGALGGILWYQTAGKNQTGTPGV
jgi:hypothetical protein